MLKGISTPQGDGGSHAEYAYPADLARFVRERWRDIPASRGDDLGLPDDRTLEQFFSACYQASLLREEERPVTFRAILARPELFPAEGMPPESLQRLEFAESFPFDATELRRLSVAADTQRTLIGVHPNADGDLRIWGLVNSGTRWLRDIQGGRRAAPPLPAVPVVHASAPGSIAASKGQTLVAKLDTGRISPSRANPFLSQWLPELFADFREELMARHSRARVASGGAWAPIEPNLPREISQRMMMRVIALLREARHGGTIIFVPMAHAEELSTHDPVIDLKYRFEDTPAHSSFPEVVVSILNRLAKIYGEGEARTRHVVGWEEFEVSVDEELATFDEALFEIAHLIAGLASADGAVVLSKLHDVLGFGGMISGRLPAVRTVARATDLEGRRITEESTENVGARHRSAYRLAGALPGVVVIVISQDGGVRFVAQHNGRVTYWEQE
jgi:hypothetical protein